jgi:hypothetical protein
VGALTPQIAPRIADISIFQATASIIDKNPNIFIYISHSKNFSSAKNRKNASRRRATNKNNGKWQNKNARNTTNYKYVKMTPHLMALLSHKRHNGSQK